MAQPTARSALLPPEQCYPDLDIARLAARSGQVCAVCGAVLFARRPSAGAGWEPPWEVRCLANLAHVGTLANYEGE